ncbi:MAG: C2 family cysteine protease [Gemmataceae bacterium]|nr:C2 family cysteine protease [Gemmataceae bacterium]MCI0738315.1 C2 family cysteine protease [Gemmataceae bacterium]
MSQRTLGYKPSLSLLEDRVLPAASLSATLFANGVLRVLGTDNADIIRVTQNSSNQIAVQGVSINVNGALQASVSAAAVASVEVYARAGNDNVSVETLDKLAKIWGEAGNDMLIGGKSHDYLYGGNGDDTLYGRNGADKLYGEAGNDKLFGEYGADFLSGGPGRDQFTGGPSGSIGLNYENFDLYRDEFDLSKPIYDTASPLDIMQGEANNCQTLAALGTIADQKGAAWVRDHIRHLGGSQFQVYFEGEQRWVNVTFDGTWSDNDAQPSAQNRFDPTGTVDHPEFWALLMNRARMVSFGINVWAHYTTARWDEINIQSGFRLKSATNALWQFTGKLSSFTEIPQATFSQLQLALNAGKFVMANSFRSGTNALGINPSHSYAVTNAFTVDGVGYVEVYNPWGFDRLGGTIDKAPGQIPLADGYITLPFSEFNKPSNFSFVFVA